MDAQPSQEYFHQRLQLLSLPIIIRRDVCYAVSLIILISSFLIFDLGSSFRPQSLFRFDLLSQILPSNQISSSSPSLSSSPSSLSSSSSPSCDYSNGRWVWEESHPLQSYTENCPFLDPGFRCSENGRKDETFRHWRWQPEGCDLPRFIASEFLERSRNGRIVFAGDSIGRNQWESLLCMLAQGVSNYSTIRELNGEPISKHKGFLLMKFHEYNLTVEYYRLPFLVMNGRPPQSNTSNGVNGTIRVDELHWYSRQWVGANVFVFNAAHWWNKYKTTLMYEVFHPRGYYFQEGGKVNMTMDVTEAFRRSLQTWKAWVVENVNPEKSFVFFRGYSPVHYIDGEWNEGGQCDGEKLPNTNFTKMESDPIYNLLISITIKEMNNEKTRAQYLNITYLSELRKDGHPSKHREPGTPSPSPQDCSHWCLPGVPDTWNELLYAHLLSKGYRTK